MSEVLAILTILGTACWAAAVVLLARNHRGVLRQMRSRSVMPAVSIFKPLKGTDDSLRENLQSFFELEYPSFELIFGVESRFDPAIDVVRSLQSRFPIVSTRLVVDSYRVGINPKINNLYNMQRHARFDIFVVSDSNVRVQPDYLTDLVERLQKPGVGLVTSAIRGVTAQSVGSILENLQMNSFVAGGVVAIDRILGIPITIGKSMCIRRATLESLGGFRTFANYLAEDYLLGKAVRDAGLKVDISPRSVDSVCSSWTIRQFINRHFRWMTMRRHINPVHYLIEIVANPILFALINVACSRDAASLALFVGACAAKTALDAVAMRIIGASFGMSHLALIPVKDLSLGLLWVAPFFVTRIDWRGNRMTIGKNSALMPAFAGSSGWLPISGRLVSGLPQRLRSAIVASIRGANLI